MPASIQIPIGLYWPTAYQLVMAGAGISTATGLTLNATGLRAAYVGRAYIDGRPTAAKTISSSGGSISWRAAGVTFSNGSSAFDIGIQDVTLTSGPAGQPDGTFDVKRTCTSSTQTPSANAWNTTTMGTGTKSITQGDLIAVVFDFTTRAGADSVVITPTGALTNGWPLVNTYNGSAWLTAVSAGYPNVVITFDDGTIGTIDGSVPFSSVAGDNYQDSTNPDERGIIFQVPFDCWVDALWAYVGITDSSSDFTLTLYSAPSTAVQSMISVAVDASTYGQSSSSVRPYIGALAAPVELLANTDYCVACRATGTSNITMNTVTLGAAGHRALYPGGTTMGKTTRDGGSGNFAAVGGSTTTLYTMGVRISGIASSPMLINSGGLIG